MTEIANSEPQKTPLNLTDLQNAVVIIDAAAERGAFKGAELTSVGAVRDKIAAVVQENTPVEEPVEETKTPETMEEGTAKVTKTAPKKAKKTRKTSK